VDIADVTVETFEGREGERFSVRFADATYDLTLARVERMPEEWGRTDVREPFAVVFHGDAAYLLPQNVWPLEHDELGLLELFVVPLGPEGEGGPMRYQAVFT
jgi:hypothetical protein